jgi:hypothetical protein
VDWHGYAADTGQKLFVVLRVAAAADLREFATEECSIGNCVRAISTK